MVIWIQTTISTMMIINSHIFKLLFLLTLIVSCKEGKVSGGKIESSQIIKLKDIVINTGNKDSYETLKGYLYITNNYIELAEISKIMTDKYSYSNAAYEVYLSYFTEKNYNDLPERYEIEAIEYLIKAYEMGYKPSIDSLENYISKGIYVEKTNNIYRLR